MGLLDRFSEAATRTAERLIEDGNTLEDAGRHRDALQRYDAALALAPALPRAHLNRGNALLATGDVKGAIASYQRVVTADPQSASGHYSLGNALARDGRAEAALREYRAAIALRPNFAEVIAAAGAVMHDLGQAQDAVSAYGRALALQPNLPGIHFRLALAQQEIGLLPDALGSYRTVLESDPENVEALSNAGTIELQLGRAGDAIACHRRAVALKPDFAEGHFNLANALRDGGRPIEACASYRRTLELKPGFLHARVGLADVTKDLGHLAEAARGFREALEINPDFQEAHTSLVFCLDHDETVDAPTLFAEHRRFGERFEAPFLDRWPAHANVRDPERPLRVGLVSGDFNAHPVGHFLEPLLPALAKRASLSLHAYSNSVLGDRLSVRLRESLPRWDIVTGLPDDALAAKIADDGIDVLVDLSGHTGRNRLQAFARKPAPLQVSWLAYPGTTGLRAMDYYFADALFLPFAEFQSQFTEKLVHLSATLPFLPVAGAPAVSQLPALANGFVTLASMSRPSKLRPPVIALWARLLRALPDARLIVAGMPQDGQFDEVIDGFIREGIARERLEFRSRSDVATYMRLHQRVDACIDTFPYTGATTTAHALTMGVPTLTLAGRTPVGRLGPSLLRRAGLGDFVAGDEDEFVDNGVRLLSDHQALAALRAGLRERCEQAPASKPEAIAASIDAALRIMWRRWCAGLPPEAFAVT